MDQNHPDYVPSIFPTGHETKRKTEDDVSGYLIKNKRNRLDECFQQDKIEVLKIEEDLGTTKTNSDVSNEACINSDGTNSDFMFSCVFGGLM